MSSFYFSVAISQAEASNVDELETPFLMREFLQCVVFIAHRAYSCSEMRCVGLSVGLSHPLV